jgi:hypothetical protein
VAEGIWTGWRGGGEFRRGEAAAARCREEEEKAKQPGREGLIGFCSSARFVEKREREREGGWSRPRPGRRAAKWRPASARGGRGAREARQQGSARAAGKVGVTRGKGKQEVDGGVDGRAAARVRVLRRQQKREAEEQRGFRGRRRRRKVQGFMWKFKNVQGLPCKVKFPVDLRL